VKGFPLQVGARGGAARGRQPERGPRRRPAARVNQPPSAVSYLALQPDAMPGLRTYLRTAMTVVSARSAYNGAMARKFE